MPLEVFGGVRLTEAAQTTQRQGFRTVQLEVLDHIMVSEQFYNHSLKRMWAFRELKVWNDHLDRADRDVAESDHAIVAAVFEYAPLGIDAGEVQTVLAAEKTEA